MEFVAYSLIMNIYAVDKVKESPKLLQFIQQGPWTLIPRLTIAHPIVLEAFGEGLAENFSRAHFPSAPKTR